MKLGLIGIVGEPMALDPWGTLERVREIGYQGVEAIDRHLLEGDVAANVSRLHALGLRHLTVSASIDDLRNDLAAVQDRALRTGADRVSVWWSNADDRRTLEREAEVYNAAGADLKKAGVRLCYHNHDHEFRHRFNGVYAMDVLALATDPESVYFTIDVGWVAVGGEDPARVLERYAGRVPVIHAKDFMDFSDRSSFTTVGTGAVDFPRALAAAKHAGVGWVVVEQDRLRGLGAFETATAAGLHLRELGVGVE